MESIDFKERNIQVAKNQPEFNTLNAFANTNDASFTYCFQLNPEELKEIQKTGKIWFKQIVGPNEAMDNFAPMQPIRPSVFKNDLIPE